MTAPESVCVVAGTRPNLIKVAPLMQALSSDPQAFEPFLVHTGQHYDDALSTVFFEQLGIPRPDRHLDVGSGSHGHQTGEIMQRFEPVLMESPPRAVIVVGDVNSTLACSIVAVKLGIPVVHVEAGLRSFDRTMPEEINRIITDSISDLLFVSEPSGVENLAREGVDPDKVVLVGNVMIDTLLYHRKTAERSTVLEDLGLEEKGYAVATLHRPANVDDPSTLSRLLEGIGAVGAEIPVVLPVHPRTLASISQLGLEDVVRSTPGLRTISPLGYLDFLKLQAHARLVMTDSGGVQEETTILGVPCVTLRENTERPITITDGTNVLVGSDPARIAEEGLRALRNSSPPPPPPPLWDGHAAKRVVAELQQRLR